MTFDSQLIDITARLYAERDCRSRVLARWIVDIPRKKSPRDQAIEDCHWLSARDDDGAALGDWLRALACLCDDSEPRAEVLRRAADAAARLVPPTEPLLERAAADAATVTYTPGDGGPAPLDEVFVPLPCRLGGERVADIEDHLDALAHRPIRCLLVGRPGSDKSTLLRHLTARLVDAGRDPTKHRPWMPERPVPTLVSIEHLAPTTDAAALWAAITGRPTHDLRGVPSDRVVLLVDGIDDIPSPDDRRQTLRALEALAARRPKMRVVACARRSSLTGYHADAFARLTLARLDDDHRRALVERWLGWLAPDALSSSSRLIERLRGSDLRDDADTPLIWLRCVTSCVRMATSRCVPRPSSIACLRRLVVQPRLAPAPRRGQAPHGRHAVRRLRLPRRLGAAPMTHADGIARRCHAMRAGMPCPSRRGTMTCSTVS